MAGSTTVTLFLRQCPLITSQNFRATSVYQSRTETARNLAKTKIQVMHLRCHRENKSYSLWKLIRCIYRFKIQDDKIGQDDLAAWACIRLDRLRDGYRFVHLLDGAGFGSKGVLLVYIEKTLT